MRTQQVVFGDLPHVKEGRKVEVAGVILIRQKPGSAKGVLFVTIEDETGVANAIIWPDRFEAQRRIILSASMIGIKGRVQREGEVIHVITDCVEDYTPLLGSIGRMDFPHRPAPGDGAVHGGPPDSWEDWKRRARDQYNAPFRTGGDPQDIVRLQTRDFR